MRFIEDKIVLSIIDELESSNKTYKQISEEYCCSVSFVQKINICKIKNSFHNYKTNIRKESQNKNTKIINDIFIYPTYGVLTIERLDKEKIQTYFSLEDLELIQNNTWTFKLDRNNNYRIRATTIPYAGKDLSTIILGEKGKVVDHINRDTLDNRRENLRVVDYSINSSNAKARSESKTNIRGVYFRKARPGIAKASWICEWSDKEGRHSKSFSVEKYGEEQAFELACCLRKEKMKEMKIQSVPMVTQE